MIYDVIVVGGGIAGLMAAIEAKTPNNKVALITKGNIFKSNSSLASGGINAVLDTKNIIEIKKHIQDTIESGKGLGDAKSIVYMCKNGGRIIEKLISYGVLFDKNEDDSIAQRSFGGGCSKRTCYVGDKTGGTITAALIKKAKSLGVEFLVNNFVLNITKLKNRVSGVVSIRRIDSSIVVYPAKAVILAGGGYAGIYRGFSTNASDYTGDMLAIALRAGVNLKDMEFVQFHPTGLPKSGYLVSEAARGEGGFLVNSDGERFINELDTRDIVSRAIREQIENGKKVYIDLRHIEREEIEKKLPSLYKSAYAQSGIDIATELLEVKPVAHYTMGGIESNMTLTSLKGLFVCGECANVGVHGANRLGGNSLLEGAVFGELAGKNALEFTIDNKFLPIDYEIVAKDIVMIDKIFVGDISKNFNAMRITLGKTMFELCGIHKNEEKLIKAFDYLKYLRKEAGNLHCIDKSKNNNVELIAILELKNALEVAEAVVLSSQKRKESRGAHSRDDFPLTNEKMAKSIIMHEFQKGYFKLWFDENNVISKIRRYITG